MTIYNVRFLTVEGIEADSPKEAAREALDIIRQDIDFFADAEEVKP